VTSGADDERAGPHEPLDTDRACHLHDPIERDVLPDVGIGVGTDTGEDLEPSAHSRGHALEE
jgi:hypothetical protein